MHAFFGRKPQLFCHHFVERSVAPVGREVVELLSKALGSRRIARKGTADKLDTTIELGRYPMDGADESAFTTPYKSHS